MYSFIPLHKLSLLLSVMGLFLSGISHAETGLELMQQYQNQHEVNSEYTQLSMTLVDKRERKRARELVIYAKKNPDGANRSLLKFTQPRDIHNVGLLTWEQVGDTEDSQWLYLPASKRIKRIASGGKKNPFMGSDLSYEDMRAENLAVHSYEVIREEALEGQDCWVIEIKPTTEQEKRESGYARRLLWLRKDIHYPVKVEYFNRRDVLTKTATYQNIENVEGEIWRYGLLTVSTLRKKNLNPDASEKASYSC